MSNTFLTAQEIARASLPILQENVIFPQLCWRDFSTASAKCGDVVQVRKPAVFQADAFSGVIAPQDVNEQSVLVQLDTVADVSVSLSAQEMALNVEDFTAQILRPAMVAVAEKINDDGFALYQDVYTCVGAAGTTPNSLEAFAEARRALNAAKAPLHPRYAVWDLDADVQFSQLDAIVNAEKSGSTQALREGSIGRVQGLENYMSGAVRRHTAGTLAATGTLAPKTDAALGAETVELQAATLTGSLTRGDLLRIDGASYVVAQDATAADNAVTVHLRPGLRAAATTASTVELIGSHVANLAFGGAAFGFISRPLEVAHGAESYVTSFEGLSLRVTLGYDMNSKSQILSVDTLYGYKTLYPELAVRVLG